MYEVQIKGGFVAAHRLKLYDGTYEPNHGHNWKVDLYLQGAKLDQILVLIDFLDVKKALDDFLKQLDYTDLNENPLLKGENPSAEIVAQLVHETLSKELNREGVFVQKCTVWETEQCAASYIKDLV